MTNYNERRLKKMGKLIEWLRQELCGFPFGTHQIHGTIYGRGQWLQQCQKCGWVFEDTRQETKK